MIENITEAFDGTRKAGAIASGALDEVANIVKPELKPVILINFVLNLSMTIMLIQHLYFTEVFQNLVVLL